MTSIIATCVLWVWTAGATDVTFHVYADGRRVATTTIPEATVCQNGYPYNLIFDVWVMSEDVNGRRSPVGVPASAQYIRTTDLDGNGITGLSDFGLFNKGFAKCNDGRKMIPCS